MYCPQCGRPIEARAADEIIGDIMALPQGAKFMVMAPLVELQKGTHQDKFKKLKAEGFARVRVNGEFYTLDDVPTLDKNKKHSIDLVVDRLVNKEGIRGRLADSVELALRYGEGRLVLHEPGQGRRRAGCRHRAFHHFGVRALPYFSACSQPAAVFVQRAARGLPALRRPWRRGLF